jgi:hypothetical protein
VQDVPFDEAADVGIPLTNGTGRSKKCKRPPVVDRLSLSASNSEDEYELSSPSSHFLPRVNSDPPPGEPKKSAREGPDPAFDVCDINVKIADLGNACWTVNCWPRAVSSKPTLVFSTTISRKTSRRDSTARWKC